MTEQSHAKLLAEIIKALDRMDNSMLRKVSTFITAVESAEKAGDIDEKEKEEVKCEQCGVYSQKHYG